MTRRALIVIMVLLLTIVLREWLAAAPVVPLRQPLAGFPALFGDWRLMRDQKIDSDTLGVLKADDYLLRTYSNSKGQFASLFIAYYRAQHAGESMHSPKNCMPGSGWAPIENDRLVLGKDGAGRLLRVNHYVIERNGQRDAVLYWYEAQGRVIASEYWGKVYMVWDSLRSGRRDGAIVRVTVPVPEGNTARQASDEALDLAQACFPYLGRFLPN